MNRQKETKAQQEARETLERLIPPGSTVYTILDSVAPSGMSRKIRLVVFKDGLIFHPNYAASTLLKWRLLRGLCGNDCIRVQGCGMDMGFHLVDTLSHALYGDNGNLRQEWL